jgi:uncharacterized protein YkwD
MNRILRCLVGLALVVSVTLTARGQSEPDTKIPKAIKEKADSRIKEPVAEIPKGGEKDKGGIKLAAAELNAPVVMKRQEEALLKLLNRLRANNKLGPVELNNALVRAARANSTELALKAATVKWDRSGSRKSSP